MSHRDLLQQAIDQYLATRHEAPNGGWPDVFLEDVQSLHKIIEMLISLKYGKDEDGELPLSWSVLDKSKYEAMGFYPVHHFPWRGSEEDFVTHLNDCMHNVEIATQRLQTALSLKHFYMDQDSTDETPEALEVTPDDHENRED